MKARLLFLLLSLLSSLILPAQNILPRWEGPIPTEQRLLHEGFTVSYNSDTKCPNWVAWTLTPEEAAADVTGRTDFFTTDPLVSGPQAEYKDYSRNKYGLDRGHMAPSADFKWSVKANEETFYLTNICPQNHTLNEGLWLETEQRCRVYAKRYSTPVHIVCGPLFGETPDTIGENRVWVPEAFFKCILLETNGTHYAIAFIIPNQDISVQEDLFEFIVESKLFTAKTGLRPFPGIRFSEPGKAFPFDIPWKKPKTN